MYWKRRNSDITLTVYRDVDCAGLYICIAMCIDFMYTVDKLSVVQYIHMYCKCCMYVVQACSMYVGTCYMYVCVTGM